MRPAAGHVSILRGSLGHRGGGPAATAGHGARGPEGGEAVKELPKPYYQDPWVQLFCGDAREILPLLPVGPNTAIVSDPPYGIGHVHGGGGKGKHNRRNHSMPIHEDGGDFDPAFLIDAAPVVILWGADHYSSRLPHGAWMAWDKLDHVPAYDNFSDVEFAWCNWRGKSRMFKYLWKGICQAGEKDVMRLHPTTKPVALMSWCVQLADARMKPGRAETIIDPFAGSGTTGRAAKDLGRKSILIEIDERYCEIAARRMRQEVLPLEFPE